MFNPINALITLALLVGIVLLQIFLSRREICTCVVFKSFAVSLWVRFP